MCAFPADRHRDEAVDVVARFGGVVTLLVAESDEVAEGDAVAIVELTKLEAAVTAPVSGRIARLAIPSGTQVAGGDLLLVIE
ncbi:biotin/lipoyl-containing protein [Flexivirga meconopsidis]|uniref:biotin/lipoyl-containing protein n=1 Tax=Flexivirga meconopsidis TaxID=2977121 RepID=UPI00223F5E2A